MVVFISLWIIGTVAVFFYTILAFAFATVDNDSSRSDFSSDSSSFFSDDSSTDFSNSSRSSFSDDGSSIFSDNSHSSFIDTDSLTSSLEINPATGMPMIDGCGIDVGGSPFGMDCHSSSMFDDSFSSSCSGFDDSFSSSCSSFDDW